MNYKDFPNFTEYVNHNATQITELGFVSFMGDHTMATAIVIMVSFVAYKIFVEPIFKEEKKLEERR